MVSSDFVRVHYTFRPSRKLLLYLLHLGVLDGIVSSGNHNTELELRLGGCHDWLRITGFLYLWI